LFEIIDLINTSHIFFAHSGITAAVSERIIERKVIKNDQIGFVLDRGIEISLFENAICFSERSFRKQWMLSKLVSVFFRLLFASKIISKDRFLDWASSRGYFMMRGFYLYLPHALLRSFKMVQSPFCLGYYYIEEGLASYISIHYTSDNRFGQPLFPETHKYCGSYGLYNAFKQSSNRVILEHLYQDEKSPKGESLIVVDGLIDHKESLVSTAQYIKVLKELIIPKALSLSKNLIIKYHPTILNEENKLVKSQLDKVFQRIEVLHPEISVSYQGKEVNLEYYCYKYMPNVFTIMSSTGHYAYEFGCPVYTAYQHLAPELKQLSALSDWFEQLTKPWNQL